MFIYVSLFVAVRCWLKVG